ncbi:M28 family peptidase [Candidatus Electronema sp. PJ]|uniref:M28 family peptidase n=1 Tax=Candidatus Electronema sp. PJ TaxID=3401572 RepID=UPI003AA8B314
MKKKLPLIGKGIAWLAVAVAMLWVFIARPINFTSGIYKPEYQVDSLLLQEHVRKLSKDFVPRDSEHPENLLRTAEYIKNALLPSADKVALQSFTVQKQQFVNVLAEYGPETEEMLVIGAHYDVFSNLPGADDNASGVAGLIELGKLLKKIPLRTRVELVAWPLEEPPYFASSDMGSAVHARSLKEKGKQVKLMIALEMIGYFSDEKSSQQYPARLLQLFYPSRGNFIAVVDQVLSNQAQKVKSALNRFTDLPAYSINAPSFVPGIDFSDHRNYWAEGFPAVMVTDTAFYRNLAYHTAHDTYDKLNYEKMAKVVYGIFKYIQEIDEKK